MVFSVLIFSVFVYLITLYHPLLFLSLKGELTSHTKNMLHFFDGRASSSPTFAGPDDSFCKL